MVVGKHFIKEIFNVFYLVVCFVSRVVHLMYCYGTFGSGGEVLCFDSSIVVVCAIVTGRD